MKIMNTEALKKQDFLPVLLGSDINVYGMARSFHEAYGYKSVAVGKGILPACTHSHIVEVLKVEPRLEEDDVFVRTLTEFAKNFSGQRLLLVPCGDNYIKMLVRNQTKLRGIYEFECISEELLMRLSIKESFYQVCEEHCFSFPKTTTCTYENHKNLELPFDFPVIIKPSNSVAYWNCKFPHKKKVFVANTREEFDAILDAIYGSSYKDHLILQEFIPGDDSKMRVMNCYCGKDKKVKLIALGNAVLEEHSPEGIGSYAAIINGYDEKLNETMKNFLEGIGYVGFANFDIKYDERDGKFKFFEINVRLGRSNFYVTGSGFNTVKWIVDDYIYNKLDDYTVADNINLYTVVPKGVIKKYVPDSDFKSLALKLWSEGKVSEPLFYSADHNLKHNFYARAAYINQFRKFRKYF